MARPVRTRDLADMLRTLSVRVEGRQQTADYIEHVVLNTVDGHKLRVRVHADTYVAQSWGVVERHDGVQWHEVASLRGDALQLKTADVCYQQGGGAAAENMRISAFGPDRDRLLALAAEVL